MPRDILGIAAAVKGMDVGMDCVSPVSNDSEKKGPFPFTGTIESVTFQFGDVKELTGMECLELATTMD